MQDPPELIKNRKELVEEMLDKYGYLFCQKCQKSKCGRNFEVHHIVFRSEAPGHPMLHSKENLIIVSDWCHQHSPTSFHRKKNEREPFMHSRNLYKLFSGYVS